MHLRIIVGMVLNVLAIVLPVTWLYVEYGPSVRVDADSAADLLALGGTTAVGFVLALCASKVSQPKSSSLAEGLQLILAATAKPTKD